MTFDAKSLLNTPPMTIDGLAAELAKIQKMGMGGTPVTLPGGAPLAKIELVAHGEAPAHFTLSDGRPPAMFQNAVK